MSFFGGSGTVNVGLQGGYKYQSPQVRALGTINVQSYRRIYDDQGKVMSKLVGDVSYLAASDKKQQGGIDKANENIFEQLQDMIADFIVLLGGGGDTGLDFGDLKYVLIGIGSLFGFGDGHGGLSIPLNPFTMAWHFFSTWLVPVDGFRDLFDLIIDTAIATILDWFGTTPILGQALQQLAQILSLLRDELDPLLSAIDGLFGLFDLALGDIDSWLAFWGPFKPLFDFLNVLLAPYIEDGLEAFNDLFAYLITWTTPFTINLTYSINAFVNIIENLDLTAATIDQVGQWFGNLWSMFDNIVFSIEDFSSLDAWIQIVTNLLIPAGVTTDTVIRLLIDSIASGFGLITGLTAELLGAGIFEIISGILAITSDFTSLLSATSTASGIILGALVTAASEDASFASAVINNMLTSLSITYTEVATWFSNLMWLIGNPINMAASDVADIILSTDINDFPILKAILDYVDAIFNDILDALGLGFITELPGKLSDIAENALEAFNNWGTLLSGLVQADVSALVAFVHGIDLGVINALGQFTTIWSNGIITSATQLAGWILDINDDILGIFDGSLLASAVLQAANIVGSLNTAVTIGTQAISSLFNGSGQFIGVLNAATLFGGHALSTVLQYITPSSGLWNAAGISGALNLAGITANSVALSSFFTGGLLNAALLGGTVAAAIIDQIAAAIKNQVNNLGFSIPDTLAGFAAVLNDLAKSVGLPTQLGSGSPVLPTIPNAPGVLGITQGMNDGLALANQGVSAFLTQASTNYNNAMTNVNIIANQFISAVVPHWW